MRKPHRLANRTHSPLLTSAPPKPGSIVRHQRHQAVVGRAQDISRAGQELQVLGDEDAGDPHGCDPEPRQHEADAEADEAQLAPQAQTPGGVVEQTGRVMSESPRAIAQPKQKEREQHDR